MGFPTPTIDILPEENIALISSFFIRLFIIVQEYNNTMHGISIAEELLRNIEKEAEKQGAKKVKEIYIEVGKLLFPEPSELEEIFRILAEDSIARDAKLVITQVKVKGKCSNGHEQEITLSEDFDPHAPAFFTCNICGEELEIESGKEVKLMKLVIEK